MADEPEYSVPATLSNDDVIAVAESAERRIAAIKRIKQMALGVTQKRDWVNYNGVPYLQTSGAEAIGRLFGISWWFPEAERREEHPDGHYSYIFVGRFTMGLAEIDAVGTRSSSDPFFSQYTYYEGNVKKTGHKPVSEIDRNDVRKAAMTNCIGNGVKRILGIRTITWDDLKAHGVLMDESAKVDFKKKDEAAKPSPPRLSTGGVSSAPSAASPDKGQLALQEKP